MKFPAAKLSIIRKYHYILIIQRTQNHETQIPQRLLNHIPIQPTPTLSGHKKRHPALNEMLAKPDSKTCHISMLATSNRVSGNKGPQKYLKTNKFQELNKTTDPNHQTIHHISNTPHSKQQIKKCNINQKTIRKVQQKKTSLKL